MVVSSNTNQAESQWLEWAAGLLLGFFTATIVVFVAACFPALEDLGVDLWMNFNVALASNDHFNSLALKPFSPDGNPPTHYVFIDVDPGGPSNSFTYETYDGACRALMKHKLTSKTLACHPTRPLNRIVLAKVLQKLKQINTGLKEGANDSHGVLAIALDVILEEDPATNGENHELRNVMGKWGNTPQIFYVADAHQPFLHNKDKNETVQLVSNQKTPYPGEARIALLPDDSVVRRYRRCFSIVEPEQDRESLPYQLALSAMEGMKDETNKTFPNNKLPKCGKSTDASVPPHNERIIYTLPHLEGHTDSDSDSEIGKRALRQARAYKAVYRRCLAAHLWDPSSRCAQPDVYKNSIVVIGASNPDRRDQHYTPLGMMSGAEVVINATRSFLEYPDQAVEGPWKKIFKKAGITFICSFLWLIYYLICHRINMRKTSQPSLWARLQTYAAQLLLFLGTLIAVVSLALGLTIKFASHNLDILLPVLIIALEQYAECAMWLQVSIKTRLAQVFVGDSTHV